MQRYYDEGHTVRECRERFGFANQTWNSAVKRGQAVARARAIPLEELLVAGRTRTSRYSLKRRLIRMNVKAPRCEECGLEEWRGRALSLALHHVNGDPHDNRLRRAVSFEHSSRRPSAPTMVETVTLDAHPQRKRRGRHEAAT